MIWEERNDVQKFMSCMDLFVMPSLQELNPISIKEALSWDMKCFISDLDVYRDKYKNNKNVSFIKDDNLLQYILALPLLNIDEQYVENLFLTDFSRPVKIEISGNNSCKYIVSFINKSNNKTFYESLLTNNMWASSETQPPENVKITVKNLTTKEIFIFEKFSERKVYVINESGSLGDTLAWTPVVNRLAVENNIKIDYFTPYKNLFEVKYPNLNFYNYNEKNKVSNDGEIYELKFDCSKLDNTKNLQEIASDILKVYHKEERPELNIVQPFKNNFDKKYVCIATHSTAQFKYWNNPTGWQQTVDYLKSIGYDVVCIDKYKYFGTDKKMNCIPKGCVDKNGDLPLEERMNDLYFCDFFIGLTSGLSWLAWSLEKPVVLISGISKEHTEFLNTGLMVIQNSRWQEITRRIFEGMACGKMVLTDKLDVSRGLEELFIDGEDIVLYNDMFDCIEKMNYYNENEEERERIAYNGMVKVIANHTQIQRVDKLMEKFDNFKKIK
jgi:autotransporter strand-loop-strand O-heptosyltransferase